MPRTPTPPQQRPKTPLPGPATLVPTEEEFAVWCEHPVTRWVALAFADYAKRPERVWLAKTWMEGDRDPQAQELERQVLFVQADTFAAFLESSYGDYLATNHPEAWTEWRKTHA